MTRSHISLRIQWVVHPEQADAVSAAVQTIMTATRREVGCLSCSLSTDLASDVSLSLAEVWDSEASLQRHLRSRRFGTLASLMETAIAQPRVEFTLPGGTRGLDYVHEVREHAARPVGRR